MKFSKHTAIIAFSVIIGLSTVNAQLLNEHELKINIQDIRNSTEQLKKLTPITFDYDTKKFNKLNLPQGNQYGFLASNVKSILPDIAMQSSQVYSLGKNTTKTARYDSVDSESLIPLLVAAIKEQQQQIESLRKELEALKEKE
ncbi:tail fiber domain-containing protein [Sphingobacterium sp. SGG-5]|uniref:tail fiber domain-containing protein n=1 Tax=Sphingobacterium sp. SGG-5 TaxID=2710881 RepID=UPI0013ED29EF|nr:tail fiber domain-containing protein [Sphingobacterium sp. SGG-5]NGM63467.1 tail fiber domain-containing protein [Sphingobacterium sp. SGG-5]